MGNVVDQIAEKVGCSKFDIEYLLKCWVEDSKVNHGSWFTMLKLKFGEKLIEERTAALALLVLEVDDYNFIKRQHKMFEMYETYLVDIEHHLKDNRTPPRSTWLYEFLSLNMVRFNWFKLRYEVDDEGLHILRRRIGVLESKVTKKALSIYALQHSLGITVIDESGNYLPENVKRVLSGHNK